MSTKSLFVPLYQNIGKSSRMPLAENLKRLREEKGLSWATLAKRVGLKSPNAIAAIEAGGRTTYLPAIARELEVSIFDLDETLIPPDPAKILPPEVRIIEPGAQLLGEKNWPVYAAVEGGPGEVIRSTEPIEYSPRPFPVAHVARSYGLYVVGESMVPEYRPGDTAIVDPTLPPLSGEVHIFYAEKDGEARAAIKYLRRATAASWLVSQWNPPPKMKADFELSRREWGVCHRVLGKYSRR